MSIYSVKYITYKFKWILFPQGNYDSIYGLAFIKLTKLRISIKPETFNTLVSNGTFSEEKKKCVIIAVVMLN